MRYEKALSDMKIFMRYQVSVGSGALIGQLLGKQLLVMILCIILKEKY